MAKATAMAAAAAVIALLLLPLGHAQERHAEAHPHGLPFESPLALTPDAYEFFHPGGRGGRARLAHGVSPAAALAPRGPQQLRESAVRGASAANSVARADQEEGGVAPVRSVRRGALRAGALAGVFVGAAAVALVALGVAFAVARRRAVVARGGAKAGAEAEAEAGAPKSNA
ncbi:hypothetical protein ACP4OV_010699 [Aristida adscensionis]